jgi:glycerophosphoryl diester phosphodiesterase
LFSVALAGTAWGAGFDFYQPLTPRRGVQVVARAGGNGLAPRDSRQAIALAIDDALEWIEVDVRRTADGHHVLAHEPTVDGNAAAGPIAQLSFEKLRELDAGAWFAKRFSGARALSLPECLTLCKNKVNLCLDCKDAHAETLVAEISSAGMSRQVIVRGNHEFVSRIRRLSAGALAVMPQWQVQHVIGNWLDELSPAAVVVDANRLTGDLCREFHQRGIKVMAATTGAHDRPADWDRVLAAGADFLESDLPEEVIAHVLDKQLAPRRVRMTCHRGASRYAPENTLPAFDKAYRLHADFVEFDVRPSRHGTYYLLHDGRLDRTTTGRGPIREASDEAIAALDAGSWFGAPFRDLRVPTLEAFLAAVPPGVSLYFDAKDITPQDLAASLTKHGLVERTVVYQSSEFLQQLRQIDQRIGRMPPASSTADVDRVAESLRPYAVDTRWNALSKAYIDHCHAAGIQVFADAPFFVDVKGYQRAIEWGIDVIQTDHPLRVWRALELLHAERGQP